MAIPSALLVAVRWREDGGVGVGAELSGGHCPMTSGARCEDGWTDSQSFLFTCCICKQRARGRAPGGTHRRRDAGAQQLRGATARRLRDDGLRLPGFRTLRGHPGGSCVGRAEVPHCLEGACWHRGLGRACAPGPDPGEPRAGGHQARSPGPGRMGLVGVPGGCEAPVATMP